MDFWKVSRQWWRELDGLLGPDPEPAFLRDLCME
jgi:hypothetical protein